MNLAPAAQTEVKQAENILSPKVTLGSMAASAATLLWMVLAKTAVANVFSEAELAALTGATVTILGGLIGYLVPDPMRRSGV